MTPTTRAVERTLSIQTSRSELFRALLDPATLSRWMYATVRMKPQKGGAYRIEWEDSSLPASAQGEILEMEQDRRLVLSWFMEQDGCETVASFELEDEDGGATLLRFRHTGFPEGSQWLSRFQMVATEWDKTLENLRFLLEERSGEQALFYQRHQVTLPATRERTHLQWMGPAALRGWLARSAFVDPAVGGIFELTLADGGEVHGIIRSFVPGKHLRLLWEEAGKRSLIGISFWTAPGGCVMTLTQRSYAYAESDRDSLAIVWQERFERLRALLAREPGDWPAGGTRSFEISRTVEGSKDRVWAACSDPASLIAWFCDRAEFTLQVGRPFNFLWTGYGETRGRLLELVPEEKLVLAWEIAELQRLTRVELQLRVDPKNSERTRVTVLHSGWGDGKDWDREVAGYRFGWTSFLAMLELFLLEGKQRPHRSLLLRRKVGLSPETIWKRLSTNEGLSSWIGGEAEIDPREDGVFLLRGQGQPGMRGRVVVADPENGLAIRLESPEPSHFEIAWAGGKGRSHLLISGLSYGTPEGWSEQQRNLWTERLDQLDRD